MTKHSETKLDKLEARLAAVEAKIAGLRAQGPLTVSDAAILAKFEADIEEGKEEIAFRRTWSGQTGPGRPPTGGKAE
jgi:hypothetical protein